MKIAQIAPLFESVPPKMYGGTERVVSYLTEELVKQGHQVSLFASGDSVTKARLVKACSSSLRLSKSIDDPVAYHIIQMEQVREMMNDFDVLHYHTDYLHFPFSQNNSLPHITTLHGRLDLPHLKDVYQKFSNVPVVSISNSQRFPLPMAQWVRTVYHGLPEELYPMGSGNGGYLAFIGRISPEKRADRAIQIAVKAGMPIKIAAKIDKVDVEYFENEIKHLMDHPLVEFIGEIGDSEKADFLGNAKALLFPIDWPEPFGMVMIEAMACGTPVIAFENGSVPEVIDEEISGYMVRSVEEAIEAVEKLDKISRLGCRKKFEERFSVRRMAEDYVQAYLKVINMNSTDNKTKLVAS